MLTMAAPKAVSIVAAIIVGYVVAAVSADGHARQPEVIGRIMEPVVRKVHRSHIGGPMKQPLLEGSHLSFKKRKMEISAQADSASRQSGDSSHRQPGNNMADSESIESQAVRGNDGNSHQAFHHPPPSSSVVVARGSGLPEPPSAYSRFTHQAPQFFRYIQYFLNNFMAAPPMMNPDFMPPPLPPFVAGAAPEKTGDKKDRSSDAKGIREISAHYQAFVIRKVKGNASAFRECNSKASAGNLASSSPLFPSVRLNRSASRIVQKHPIDLFLAARRKAAVSRAPRQRGGAGNLQDSASSNCRCCALKARLALLFVLLVATSILLALSVYLIVKPRKTKKIQTKCVEQCREYTDEEEEEGLLNV